MQNRKGRTGMAERDRQNRTSRTRISGQDCQDRTAKIRLPSTGLPTKDC
jgi:hypothetical protein